MRPLGIADKLKTMKGQTVHDAMSMGSWAVVHSQLVFNGTGHDAMLMGSWTVVHSHMVFLEPAMIL